MAESRALIADTAAVVVEPPTETLLTPRVEAEAEEI